MTDHHEGHDEDRRHDPEAPDPAGNPADHTSPRENQEVDPDRLEKEREDADRTIAS